jgi:hypothetical protein
MAPPQPPPAARPPVLMATVDSLTEPYQILGLVDASMAAPTGIVPTARLMDLLADQAAEIGADAVIGIRLSQFTPPVASRFRLIGRRVTDHLANTVVATAIGTAIRRHGASPIDRSRSCRHSR